MSFNTHRITYFHSVKDADISLCVLSLLDVLVPPNKSGLATTWKIQLPDATRELATSPNTYFILNKADLIDQNLQLHDLSLDNCEASSSPVSQSSLTNRAWIMSLSKQQGTGLFLEGFGQELRRLYSSSSHSSGSESKEPQNAQAPIITRARHRVHLESACTFLQAFLECRTLNFPFFLGIELTILPIAPEDIVLAAEELRYAARALGKVSGAIDIEDILDAVFRDFCIGK